MQLRTIPRHRAVAAAIGILILGGLLAASGHVIAVDHNHDHVECIICSWFQHQACIVPVAFAQIHLTVCLAVSSAPVHPWTGCAPAAPSRAPPAATHLPIA